MGPHSYAAEGVPMLKLNDPDSVEFWKDFVCFPSQALIHFVDGRASLVIGVREGGEESHGPVLVLGDVDLKETDTLECLKLLHATAPHGGVDYIVRGFVKGCFTSARRRVRVASLESGGKGSITSLTVEIIPAQSSSSAPLERMKRTLPTFIKEFVLPPGRSQ
ncbi:MAG: hypothetical protein SGPRY_010258, partial [Prymnesium sp.]